MAEHVDLLSSVGLCVSVAAVLAFVANRLRQPLLLAYLLAGVLIGPQIGLRLIEDQQSIQTVSEIGLILLLFMIGLEMDLKKLLVAGKPVLVTGVLQFLLCVALGLLFFYPLGFRVGNGDFALLYIAVCCAISSTMIVVKLLYDKAELDTLPGRITLGVLVFQDIWAIVVLGHPAQSPRPAVRNAAGLARQGRVARRGEPPREQVAPAAALSLGRQAAGAHADRVARVVLHGERGSRRRGALARDGGARRRHQHLDFPVQHGRRRQGRQHPRLLRDAVLRRARNADSDAYDRR